MSIVQALIVEVQGHLVLLLVGTLSALALHALATSELASKLLGLSISVLVVGVVLCSKLAGLLHIGKTSGLVLLA